MLNLPIKILQTQQIETAQATVTFANIDTLVAQWDAAKKVTSRHLVVIVNAASPDAVAKRAVEIQLNGDAGANYNHQTLTGEDAVADADRQDGVNYLFEYPGLTDYPFAIPGTTYANAFGGGTILFPHAFNTANHKTALALGGAVEDYVNLVAGRWASVAAITSLVLSLDTGNFAIGSTFHIGVIDERYLVEEQLLAAPGAVTFDNISQGEGDLAVVIYARSVVANILDNLLWEVNDDAVAANYWTQRLSGDGVAAGAATLNNQEFGIIAGDTATVNAFGGGAAIISQYTKGNQPHALSFVGFHSSAGPRALLKINSSRRNNIEPIHKLRFSTNVGTNFLAGSLVSLYRVPKRIIQRVELTAPQATITFANIPQNFEALVLHVYTRSSVAALVDEITITINADAVLANYDFQELTGRAIAAAVRNLASQQILYIPADNEGVGEFSGGSALFLAYAETDRHKHIIALHGQQENRVALSSHRWENTNAIATIALSLGGPNFLAGSVFELEGILRKEGLPPDEGMLWGV
jgi:hypothetical protein